MFLFLCWLSAGDRPQCLEALMVLLAVWPLKPFRNDYAFLEVLQRESLSFPNSRLTWSLKWNQIRWHLFAFVMFCWLEESHGSANTYEEGVIQRCDPTAVTLKILSTTCISGYSTDLSFTISIWIRKTERSSLSWGMKPSSEESEVGLFSSLSE